MQPLTSSRLKGNWATILLPLCEDERIDFRQLREQISRLIEAGVDGIYCNGTSCEFYNQTEDEFDSIVQLLSEMCESAGMAFQIGASHMSPITSLERIKRARGLKPGAFQVILPNWHPLAREEQVRFMRRLAEASDGIGLVLYNPGFASTYLDPDELAMLCRAVPQIIGVKGPWRKKLREHCPDLSIFVPGHELATAYSEDASGAYSNMACLNPHAAQCWYQQMQTDLDGALELESRIQEFMEKHIHPYIAQRGFSGQAVDKFMAAVGKWCGITPKMRWPHKSIPTEDLDSCRAAVKEIIPEFIKAG